MAEYTNLASLEGLKNGDVIRYNASTVIDFKGLTVNVELYGQKVSSNGGVAKFTIDTALLPNTILSFCNSRYSDNLFNTGGGAVVNGGSRNDLIYGNTPSAYYRIAVAGNSGLTGKFGSTTYNGGKGGGTTGGAYSTATYAGKGGTQTAGGAKGSGYGSSSDGYFAGGGQGGTRATNTKYGGRGGYGWYGGGGGNCPQSGSYAAGGGGGSGFIIGQSTTTYPSSYLGGDKNLQNTIASAISEGELVQGGSDLTTPIMILTIVNGGVEDEPEQEVEKISTLKYYNGTSLDDVYVRYFNGTEYVPCNVYRFNGTEYVKIGG